MSADTPDNPKPDPPPAARPRAFWARRRTWWQLGLVILAALALTGVDRAEKHVKSPAFCGSCHAASVQQVHAGVHKQLECTACHQDRVDQDLHQWALGFLSSTRTTPHGKVDLARCKACHTRGTDQPWQIARTNGHEKHILKADKPIECSACHTLKDHGTAPRLTACRDCHKLVQMYGAHGIDGHRDVSCLACHNYLATVGGGALTPAYACQRCHGGVDKAAPPSRFSVVIKAAAILPTMIHGNLQTCAVCHQPHAKDSKERFRGLDCSLCHVKVSKEFHNTKMPDRFDCTTCHKPHGPRTSLVTACTKCHGQKAADDTTAAKHKRCSQCHTAHVFEATVDGCRDCHADKALLLASWNADKHDVCTNCHKPHATAQPEAQCTTCHKSKTAPPHKACTTCHDPHNDAAHAKACAGCHTAQGADLAHSVPQHRASTCMTCHKPHAPLAALTSCKTCHSKEVQLVSSAAPPKHKLCLSCHQPHTFTARVAVCSTCHNNPTSGAHTGACTQCHQVHGPPIGQMTACSNCHKDVAPRGKHGKCATCHKGSHGAGLKAPLCGTCHQAKAVGVSAWKPATHQTCTNCHQKHDPTSPKTCNQCHLEQARQVAATKHKCESCHDAHQAPTDARTACNKCHAQQVTAVRGRGATHSVCGSCHKPHAFAKPTCTSCHASLPGAHVIHAKARCNDCHDTHARKTPERKDCLRCHAAKADHFPNAQNCAGCHLFTKVH